MNTEHHDALDEMSLEFIAEIKDDLASLEPDLLIMEQKGGTVDDDLINHAFRSIHSIKGGAGFINFTELSGLSHAMESVMMRMREKRLTITSEIVDALLSGFDKMKLMVELMGTGKACDGEVEKAGLQAILHPETSKKEQASQPETLFQVVKPLGDNQAFKGKVFSVDKHRLENALNSQKFVYAVHIRIETDLEAKQKSVAAIIEDVESIGDILFSDLENQADEKRNSDFFCVISTILDLPLLAQVLEISRTQMTLVDRQFTDNETILKTLAPRPVFVSPSEPAPVRERISKDRAVPDPRIEMPSTAQTIRINVGLISRLMNRAGELVLSRNQLRPFMEAHAHENNNADQMMQNLDMVTTDIQEAIVQMRMQPIIDLMGKYKRVVRDIARRISKKVELVLEGADVEVDRTVLEKLANPVTHLIRNCIDHGIESPEDRCKFSKPETGIIRIKAFHQGGHVHIIISDDGAGIDPQLVLSKAFERGLVSEDQLETLTDKQKIDLIFCPGFSTSEEITDISGRGVGMDVVKTNIERLRGHIEIDSVKGEGTCVHLIIPLTLAIVPSLIVRSGTARFAVPQVNVKEVIFLEPGKIHCQVEQIAGSEVFRIRNRLIPILRLRNVLGIKTYIQKSGTQKLEQEKRKAIADRRQAKTGSSDLEKRGQTSDRRQVQWDTTYVVILKLGMNVFGLCVDEIYDIEEVVVEPLSEYIKQLKCFAGTTILGDGDVIMVLDVPGIASFAHLRFDTIKIEELKRKQQGSEEKKGKKKNLLVFGNGDKEFFALELTCVARLEPVTLSDMHYSGKFKYVEHKSHAVLLLSMDQFLPAGDCRIDKQEGFVIFLKHLSASAGILASRIVDTIETREPLNRDRSCPESVLGKIFIKDMMVQVLDPERLVSLVEDKARLAAGMG